MDRLTEKRKDGYYVVSGEDTKQAIQRLGLYEDAYESLINSLEQIPKDLEDMRQQGKEKTVRYKETLTQKLINNNIVMFFQQHGVK